MAADRVRRDRAWSRSSSSSRTARSAPSTSSSSRSPPGCGPRCCSRCCLGVLLDRLFTSWWRRRQDANERVIRVATPDGASIAVHDARASPDEHPTVLFAHATGSTVALPARRRPSWHRVPHVRARLPRSRRQPPRPAGRWTGTGYGDDARGRRRRDARRLGADALLGVGHSMGGGALLMAALDDPSLFAGLRPVRADRRSAGRGPSGPASPATRWRTAPVGVGRRSTPSRRRSPTTRRSRRCDAFDPDALDAYVRFGVRAGRRRAGAPEVRRPSTRRARSSMGAEHRRGIASASSRDPGASSPGGRVERFQPSAFAAVLAERAARRPSSGGSTSSTTSARSTHPARSPTRSDASPAAWRRRDDGPEPL